MTQGSNIVAFRYMDCFMMNHGYKNVSSLPSRQKHLVGIACIMTLAMLTPLAATANEHGAAGADAEEPTSTSGERREYWSIALGPRIGPSLVSMTGADGDVLKAVSKLSFAAGAFARVGLYRFLAVQPEILFASKGAGRKAGDNDAGAYTLDYIEIPLLFHVSMPVHERFTPYAVIGPALSVLLGAESRSSTGTITDIKDLLTSTDFGLVLGAGSAFSLGSWGALTLDARYDLGMSNIAAMDESNIKTRSLSFLLGYEYRLPRSRQRIRQSPGSTPEQLPSETTSEPVESPELAGPQDEAPR